MVPCWLKSPWPHLNIMHAAELFSLESPLYVWQACDWLVRARPFKRMLTQTFSWTVPKELLKNFLTHLFYNIGLHIRQPSIFREWESIQHSKLIKAHTVCFFHNSSYGCIIYLLGALKELGQLGWVVLGSMVAWVRFLSSQEWSPGLPTQAFPLLISKLSEAATDKVCPIPI